MDSLKHFGASSEGKSPLTEIETEWKALLQGEGEIGLYLYHLDRFLISFTPLDEVTLASMDALSTRCLQFLYPNGEGGPKRDISSTTVDDVQKALLHPEAIKSLLGEKALQLSQGVKDAMVDTLGTNGPLH